MDNTTTSTADAAAIYSNDKPAAEQKADDAWKATLKDKSIVAPKPTVSTLRIHVTPERMRGLNVAIWAEAEDSRKTSDTLQVLKHFVVGPSGHYIPDNEALVLLRQSTMGELNDALAKLMEMAQEAAVPNE